MRVFKAAAAADTVHRSTGLSVVRSVGGFFSVGRSVGLSVGWSVHGEQPSSKLNNHQ